MAESLQPRTLRLTVIAARTPKEVPTAVEQILAARPDPGHGPLWVELRRGSDSEGWPRARRQALQRLNERRFLLERDVARPMILILPREEQRRVYVEAPDLWAVRSLTAELPTPAPPQTQVPHFAREIPLALDSPPGQAELEWARLLQRAEDPAAIDLRDGFAAFASAMERGDLAVARAIANQTLHIARQQSAAVGGPSEARNEASRNLSISLNNLGQVERDLGNPEAARAIYRESLDLCRRLREAVGDTPQALRDLSVSLEQVSGSSSAISAIWRPPAPPGARAWTSRRRLREAVGDTPQALRDLSISLDNVGEVERDLGNLEAARTAYRESLESRRRLREAVGDTPQALRDLSISLDYVGEVERDLGDLEAARGIWRESLEIARRLSATFPDQPQLQQNLARIEARSKALLDGPQ